MTKIRPINTTADGLAFAIKASYFRNTGPANLTNGGGTSQVQELSKSPKIIPIGKIWKSESNGWVYHKKGLSPTICCGAHNGVQPKINVNMAKIYRIRKLTPRECYRLMGVCDSDIDKIKQSGVSDSQQYKQAGNSIVVNVLEGIFTQMFRADSDCLF